MDLLDPNALNAQLNMAKLMAQSNMLPNGLSGNPANLLVVLQQGRELGFSPMQSINSINMIKGTPTIKPQAMLSLIYRAGGDDAVVEIEEYPEQLKVVCSMARTKKNKPYVSTWDMKRAGDMGLAHKDNWKKQPMTMLKWRAISDAARVVFADVIAGIYLPDEIEKIKDHEKQPPKEMPCEQVPVENYKAQFKEHIVALVGDNATYKSYVQAKVKYDHTSTNQEYWKDKLEELLKINKDEMVVACQ